MGHDRFYSDKPLETRALVTLNEEESNHLYKVMRLTPGDRCMLVDGLGHLAQAEVRSCSKSGTELQVLSIEKAIAKKPLFLAIPYLTPPKIQLIIEKGCEIGVDNFILFSAFHSEKTALSDSEHLRLKRLLIAALKQSDRLYMPKMLFWPPLLKWEESNLAEIPINGRFYGSLDEKSPPLLEILKKEPTPSAFLFATGPEKGFSKEEVIHLKRLSIQGARLVDSILRAETAPIAGSAFLASARDF